MNIFKTSILATLLIVPINIAPINAMESTFMEDIKTEPVRTVETVSPPISPRGDAYIPQTFTMTEDMKKRGRCLMKAQFALPFISTAVEVLEIGLLSAMQYFAGNEIVVKALGGSTLGLTVFDVALNGYDMLIKKQLQEVDRYIYESKLKRNEQII